MLLLLQHLWGPVTPGLVALADEPISVMVQLRSPNTILELSTAYQVQILADVPALGIYLVETTATTAALLAADPRVVAVQQNSPLSTFSAQQRATSGNDFDALQRYFGFGNGEDDSELDTSGEKSVKQKKSGQEPSKDGPPDQVLVIYDDQPYKKEWLDWGLERIKLHKVQKYATGNEITVALLDTGADMAHPQLVGHLVAGYDFVDGDTWPNDEPNGLDEDGDTLVDEGSGHGTHIANIIAMVAPHAKIMPIRVLNSDGGGTLFDILAGIVYAVDHGAQVINMSFSAVDNSPFLEEAVHYAAAKQVLLIAAAAGATGYLEFPAAYDQVIAVGATKNDDHIASFSAAYGAQVDIFAPGELIYSAYYGGRTAWWSGTSMAAPFVAGAAALMIDYCRCSVDLVRSVLLEEVTNVKPKMAHRGRLNLEKVFKELEPAWQPCDAGKPQALTFLYTGEACTASRNSQGDKFSCSGPPPSDAAAVLLLKDEDKIHLSAATVQIGELVTVRAADKKLKSTLEIAIAGQSLKIETSCSQPLKLNEQFGALRLVAYTPEGTFSSASTIDIAPARMAHQLFVPLVAR